MPIAGIQWTGTQIGLTNPAASWLGCKMGKNAISTPARTRLRPLRLIRPAAETELAGTLLARAGLAIAVDMGGKLLVTCSSAASEPTVRNAGSFKHRATPVSRSWTGAPNVGRTSAPYPGTPTPAAAWTTSCRDQVVCLTT